MPIGPLPAKAEGHHINRHPKGNPCTLRRLEQRRSGRSASDSSSLFHLYLSLSACSVPVASAAPAVLAARAGATSARAAETSATTAATAATSTGTTTAITGTTAI